MHPVSFVRSHPTGIDGVSDEDAPVCGSCGSSVLDVGDASARTGYVNSLSLDTLLVRHPSATYFVQVGDNAEEVVYENTYLGVRTGDILTIDRALTPAIGSLVLAVCDGELVLCRYTEHEGKRFLVCGRESKKAVEIDQGSGVSVWGVVAALSRRL